MCSNTLSLLTNAEYIKKYFIIKTRANYNGFRGLSKCHLKFFSAGPL